MKFTTISNAAKQAKVAYLGNINKSAKLAKNGKINHQYTYGIYLAPASTSGYNVCSHSTPECRIGCLATSGRAGMEIKAGKTKTQNSRANKTRLFFEHQEFFMTWLIAEIEKYQEKANNDGYDFSARLNCTSDINWQKVMINGKNIFELFPMVQFYDYTKNPKKFENIPSNYHLTFSYTGRNWQVCEALLQQGHNIAMVFDAKNENELPTSFRGYKVVNGDLTDYRVADGKGIIVGLKFKHIANKEAEQNVLNSCFVVKANDIETTINVQELQLVA